MDRKAGMIYTAGHAQKRCCVFHRHLHVSARGDAIARFPILVLGNGVRKDELHSRELWTYPIP